MGLNYRDSSVDELAALLQDQPRQTLFSILQYYKRLQDSAMIEKLTQVRETINKNKLIKKLDKLNAC